MAGMGQIHLALAGQRGLETVCVIKRLRSELRLRAADIESFRHEADLARRLVHSNLVHTHAVDEVKGEVFLVQEYVEGQDVSALLDKLAAQSRRLPVAASVYAACSILRGLEYAHDFDGLGLVHRDINPPNIRISYEGEVKLLDFGIALSKLQGEDATRGRGAGKLAYMAPESGGAGDDPCGARAAA
jgi:eukaryotic-like serine/threonine-protein kinase